MYNDLSNNYIEKAIDELVNTFGIAENVPEDIVSMILHDNKVEQCIKAIATKLGLPIKIELSFVPKNFRSGNRTRFESKKLVKTDWSGRGVGGITAQVLIPENLPSFGSSKLNNYPIKVRVSENCTEEPETFITIIAHELSHVLLKSIWHPEKDNEFYTDFVPLIFGFGNIVEVGRKIETPESIITYGYLTDEQFSYSIKRIRQILGGYNNFKASLIEQIRYIRLQSNKLQENLLLFDKLIQDIANNSKKRINKSDGLKLVKFHAPDYTLNIRSLIQNTNIILAEIEEYCKRLVHYTSRDEDKMKEYREKLDLIRNKFDANYISIKSDLIVLNRNLRLSYKIKRFSVNLLAFKM